MLREKAAASRLGVVDPMPRFPSALRMHPVRLAGVTGFPQNATGAAETGF